MRISDSEADGDRSLERRQIGRYLVNRRLGGGGGASVYQAYDQVLGRTVALKVLPPNPDTATLDRFRREALMAGALRHPHIVHILQVGVAANGGPGYIAMDLVEGESLADLLARFGTLRADESCNLLAPVASALAFAHAHGVVHRDVKPSNILLRTAAPAEAHSVQLEALEHPVTPLLSDFGVARFLDAPELTSLGRTVGTPAYMAPEQCTGNRDVDGRADIYALGTVLYRCVIGRMPFAGTTTQILHAHVYDAVTIDAADMERLPEDVPAILQRCLAKAPEDRYQNAAELSSALKQVAQRSRLRTTPAVAALETTATLTMASLPIAPAPSEAGARVLVAGSSAASAPAMPVRPMWRRQGLQWFWAALAVAVALIGMATGSRLLTGEPPPAPAATKESLVAATATPTAVPTATTGVSAAAALSYTIVHPAATLLPTPIPTPQPTATPTIMERETPVATPASQPSEKPEATPTVAATLIPPETPLVIPACSEVAGEFFATALQSMSVSLVRELGCPSGPATSGPGTWQEYARGIVIVPHESALVYVYYAGNQEWEQVPRPSLGPDRTDLLDELVFQVEARRIALGEPLPAGASPASVVTQRFDGGLLMGNLDSGMVVVLGRSKLRF